MKHLILRNCFEDGTSHNGFQWDTEIGAVNIAPDFDPIPECGQGLHGWLGGEGNASTSSYNNSPLWLVLSVEKYIDLGDKVKFETCTVVFKGTKAECAKYIYDNGGAGKKIIGLTGRYSLGGDLSVLDGGYGSTQKAGDWSTQTAWNRSTHEVGKYSNVITGDGSKVKAGIGTVIIHRWELNTKTFTIGSEEADKWFEYKNGKQIKI